MAVIKGKFIDGPDYLDQWGVNDNYFDDFDDDLVGDQEGKPEADTIDGLGGDDRIWGGFGDDVMYGGWGDDVIKPALPEADIPGDWGYDEAHGGLGSDNLDFRNTTHHVALYGDENGDFLIGGSAWDYLDGGSGDDHIWGFGGDDKIWGGSENDWVYAGDGEDFLSGGKGVDHLFGDGENDVIWAEDGDDYAYGGYGNDELQGGDGRDELWGGSGHDKFMFHMGDSDPSNPDHITDFQATAYRWVGAYDTIDMMDGPAGSVSNYVALSIGSTGGGYDAAKNSAEAIIGGATRYVFVTDGVDGYLFSDEFGNGSVDNGIVLEGLNSPSDFSFSNIL